MEPMELTVTELARSLGVSRKTLSKIVNERGSVTAEMALRLGQAFETSPDMWMNLQKAYDLWKASQKSSDWKKVVPIAA
jgi:addiction module HigA family antidote